MLHIAMEGFLAFNSATGSLQMAFQTNSFSLVTTGPTYVILISTSRIFEPTLPSPMVWPSMEITG